ncbi:hypothetical protein SAMD00079811_33150 [Scytonema sp. HK-05]|uniref:hypothetical protein n=1 Tax=Scytonema sp. HK-05 TaxID=1137095 RepID=UPI0009369ADB|nr:hypothetical protein [Scytonema sp. HK-05]OKH45590.1 hypothetical protein NIES2130_37100 [Scytonema sp. HK-05]BAY45708.1 hypothetical protein SAMD00079811_33150 [Scytonema sp. HK-05]
MTTIRFQADGDFNQNIVTGVLRRESTIDFQTALVADLEGLQDRQVLQLAAKQGWTGSIYLPNRWGDGGARPMPQPSGATLPLLASGGGQFPKLPSGHIRAIAPALS